MLDELLMLFYIATANNPHIDLVSVLNHKFTNYVPASVMVNFLLLSNPTKVNSEHVRETSYNRYEAGLTDFPICHSKIAAWVA